MEFKTVILLFLFTSAICHVNTSSSGNQPPIPGVPTTASLSQNPLLDSSQNRFVIKHLYLSGLNRDANGNLIDSFDSLSKDPTFAKKYIIELHERLYNGAILPNEPKESPGWLKNLHKKKLSIVDADITTLKADIATEFEKWKATKATGKPDEWVPNIWTTEKHKVTQISYHWNKATNIVTLRAEQIYQPIYIAPNLDGTPVHFAGETFSLVNPQDVTKLKDAQDITKFSTDELDDIAGKVKAFWRNTIRDNSVSPKAKNIKTLNVENPIYLAYKRQLDTDIAKKERDKSAHVPPATSVPGVCSMRGKARSSSQCAVMLNPSGKVESINPNEFIEQYMSADHKGKQTLAELIKDNQDKIYSGGNADGDMEKLKNFMEFETLNQHVQNIKIVDQLQGSGPKTPGGVDTGDVSSNPAKHIENLDNSLTDLNSKVKLSESLIVKQLSKPLQGFSTGVGHASTALGTFFLAKTVVNGIISGDETSLAIIGARVGYEVATESAVAVGTKYFSTASKVGKTTSKLGKVAGPIGAVANVGLSVWSMTKSIQSLKNATNKYDRADAIIDIVTDSIDIVNTAVVTILSIAFPPFAPLIAAIGFLVDLLVTFFSAVFKAANAVKRIDAEIPLSAREKEHVFNSRLLDWFGTRKPDYIDHLLEEKNVNNMAVQQNLLFLEQNTDILGIIFPARTLQYDGGCTLSCRHCAFKFIGGCWRWERRSDIGWKCDLNRPCTVGTSRVCVNQQVKKNSGYDDYECRCSGPKFKFGVPRANSMVDFRSKKRVYWERSVPSDVSGGVFQCKPGTLNYIDYKISEGSPRTEYLCEQAIGLLQPSNRRKSGQSLLFDLDDGNDKAYAATTGTTPNIFRMGNDGNKEFYGGAGRDDFLFDAVCSKNLRGHLSGGGNTDGITLGNNCTKGNTVTVDFRFGRITSSKNNVTMTISGIEELIGRKDEADTVQVACSTKRVIGQGGKSDQLDTVNIPRDTSCSYNLTIVATAYTRITSAATRGEILLAIDNPATGLVADLDLQAKNALKLTVLFLKTTSNKITSWSLTKQGGKTQVKISATGQGQVEFALSLPSGANDIPFLFSEEPNGSPYSTLILSDPGTSATPTALLYHLLPELSGSPIRSGSKTIENIFNITANGWQVTGGDKPDQFLVNLQSILLLSQFTATLDGGKGTDTLRFHPSFYGHATLNLQSPGFRSIENIIGYDRSSLTVRTACDTEVVSTGGGELYYGADVITINGGSCPNRQLKVVASGQSKVIMEKGRKEVVENDIVTVIANGVDTNRLKFELTTQSPEVANMFVVVVTGHKNWTLANGTHDSRLNVLLVDLKGEAGEWVKLNLKTDPNATSSNVDYPYIQVTIDNSTEKAWTLLNDRDDRPKVLYTLDPVNDMSTTVEGFFGFGNIFRLETSDRMWKVTGGGENDVFLVQATEKDGGGYYIEGGTGGENQLIIEGNDQQQSSFLVHLANEEIGYLRTPQEKRGKISNVHHIFGRVDLPDKIHAACSTKTINGRGGASAEMDTVNVNTYGCKMSLATTVGNFTHVESNPQNGDFTYIVDNLSTSSLDIHASTKLSDHYIRFNFYPWEAITAVAFNESTQEMGWKTGGVDGRQERLQIFGMFKPSEGEDYNNPVFDFYREGSKVVSDIRVSADGVTMTTNMITALNNPSEIKGVPVDVNRFLVNVTSASSTPQGTIKGSPHSSANQFWILNMQSILKELDGGACPDGRSTNYLHFDQKFRPGPLIVDLSSTSGSVKKASGKEVISRLKNIHELHGTRDMTVHTACDTAQVSNVKQVIIKSASCPMNLVIGLKNDTSVFFEEATAGILSAPDSTIHYRFETPMSFEPQGDYLSMLRHSHNYYLPFKLNSLRHIRFDHEEDIFFYSMNGRDYYNHSMITVPGYNEQFYAQPSMVTEDGYRIQIARDGSIWATLGDMSTNITSASVPNLQKTANNLGISMLLETPTQLYFIGYHAGNSTQERNVLQNIPNVTCHLAGGGADNTIYEITNLDKDAYIYTGFEETAFKAWLSNGNETKQTIDLTDVVVPIRAESDTKYVPQTSLEKNNLVISMVGYEDQFPGRLVIVNGSLPWVAKRIQLLLSSSLMDLVPDADGVGSQNNSTENQWTIRPRPVVVPDDIVIYSISPDDLEDGQEILIGAASGGGSHVSSVFSPVQNGPDLYITNAVNLNQSDVQTVIISDFYGASNEKSAKMKSTNTNKIAMLRDVTISSPGLHLVLNETNVINMGIMQTGGQKVRSLQASPVLNWNRMLHEKEEKLLVDLPQVKRTFKLEE